MIAFAIYSLVSLIHLAVPVVLVLLSPGIMKSGYFAAIKPTAVSAIQSKLSSNISAASLYESLPRSISSMITSLVS